MNRKNIIYITMIITIFLFSIGFMNLSGYIYSLIMIMFLLNTKIKKIDINTIILLLYSIFYFLGYTINFGFSLQSLIIYLFSPWCSYFIAKRIVAEEKYNKNIVITILYTFMLGFFIYGLLNLFTYLKIYGTNHGWRISYDFWRREVSSVTCNGLYFTPIFSFSIGYLFFGNRKIPKFTSIIAIIFSIYAALIYKNRTLILIGIVLALISIIITLLTRTKTQGKKIKFLLFLIAMITIFICANGIDYISDLEVFKRIVSDKDSTRISLWIEFLKKNPFKYIFGGANLHLKSTWVHNLWLDILYKVGVIPFLLLSVFSIKAVLATIKLYKYSEKNSALPYCIMILFIGELINCMVEPVIDANPYIFIFFIITSTIVINLASITEKTKKLKLGKGNV